MIGSAAIANFTLQLDEPIATKKKILSFGILLQGQLLLRRQVVWPSSLMSVMIIVLMQNLQTENLTNLQKSIYYEWISLAKV